MYTEHVTFSNGHANESRAGAEAGQCVLDLAMLLSQGLLKLGQACVELVRSGWSSLHIVRYIAATEWVLHTADVKLLFTKRFTRLNWT